ncbi:MAG: transposase [Methyloligellaceae bacterium]
MRQTHGFTKSLFDLLDLDLPVASVATLCRRRKALSIAPWVREYSEPLDLVLDSTDLKIFGQGTSIGSLPCIAWLAQIFTQSMYFRTWEGV